jgi:hypothetical protein
MRRTTLIALAVAAVITLIAGPVAADVSKAVIGQFRGQLIITKDELPEGGSDKETASKIRAARLTEVTGRINGEVTEWTFRYAAFLSKTGATALKLEFWKDGKQYVADKRFDGIDPKSALLTGEITIDEDENITKGKSYALRLVAGNHVVAQTTLVMK